jgi:hypothetical protein
VFYKERIRVFFCDQTHCAHEAIGGKNRILSRQTHFVIALILFQAQLTIPLIENGQGTRHCQRLFHVH